MDEARSRFRRRLSFAAPLAAVLALAVGACGGGAPSTAPASSSDGSAPPDVRLLTSGLAANLDKLASYKFSEDIYSGVDTGSAEPLPESTLGAATAQATAVVSGQPGGTRSLRIEGTVVSGPGGRSIAMSMSTVEYVVVGQVGWSSSDGDLWAPVDDLPDVLSLLPAAYYGTWFDPNVTGFRAVGEETHNGVDCTRFSGSDSLGNLYASQTGASFQADLWIAKDGSYPVGGRYLIPVGGSYSGYSFEITDVNDAANAVAVPTNVVALPS